MANKVAKTLIFIGLSLFILGLVLLLYIFLPVVKLEIKYQLDSVQKQSLNQTESVLEPVDWNFGLVIPKININARVITAVNPFNPAEYQQALARGVAQAKGSSLPGEKGNLFIFSHSSENAYIATRYNSIFYLINKLNLNDEIIIYYLGNKYIYHVHKKTIVAPKEISYLDKQNYTEKTITLMTCWPPGTNFNRLLIQGQLVE